MFKSMFGRSRRCAVAAQARPLPRPALVESLEERRLMSVTVDTYDQWQDLSGYSLYAAVQIGSNTTIDDVETEIGTADGMSDEAQYAWDLNPSDGIDSGYKGFTFTADLSGGTADYLDWNLQRVADLQYSGAVGSTVSQVVIAAYVDDEDMAMGYSNMYAYFYRDGQLVETISLGSSATANTIGMQGSSPVETVVTVTPTDSDCDKVVVSGRVRLQQASQTIDSKSQIFGKVMVFSDI